MRDLFVDLADFVKGLARRRRGLVEGWEDEEGEGEGERMGVGGEGKRTCEVADMEVMRSWRVERMVRIVCFSGMDGLSSGNQGRVVV